MARAPDGTIVQSPAFPPQKIIDSLGAGDTFTAAILFYLNKTKLSSVRGHSSAEKNSGEASRSNKKVEFKANEAKREIKQNHHIESLEQSHTEFIDSQVLQSAVTFACRVAGAKIGLKGYDGLNKVFKDLQRI